MIAMFELDLSLNPGEGALMRLLGTIERRGFRVSDLECRERRGMLAVRLKVDGRRPAVEVLVRQLKRLHEVREVVLVPLRESAPRPPARHPRPPVPASAISRRSLSFLGIPDPVPREDVRP